MQSTERAHPGQAVEMSGSDPADFDSATAARLNDSATRRAASRSAGGAPPARSAWKCRASYVVLVAGQRGDCKAFFRAQSRARSREMPVRGRPPRATHGTIRFAPGCSACTRRRRELVDHALRDGRIGGQPAQHSLDQFLRSSSSASDSVRGRTLVLSALSRSRNLPSAAFRRAACNSILGEGSGLDARVHDVWVLLIEGGRRVEL